MEPESLLATGPPSSPRCLPLDFCTREQCNQPSSEQFLGVMCCKQPDLTSASSFQRACPKRTRSSQGLGTHLSVNCIPGVSLFLSLILLH